MLFRRALKRRIDSTAPPPINLRLYIGLGRMVAFIMGALFSLIVGQFGMRMAVQGNVRVAAAARTSFSEALKDRLPFRDHHRHAH